MWLRTHPNELINLARLRNIYIGHHGKIHITYETGESLTLNVEDLPGAQTLFGRICQALSEGRSYLDLTGTPDA